MANTEYGNDIKVRRLPDVVPVSEPVVYGTNGDGFDGDFSCCICGRRTHNEDGFCDGHSKE